ncbi:MAG: hypothetical protein ACT4O0_04495, partial [Pseudonocardia sp.]
RHQLLVTRRIGHDTTLPEPAEGSARHTDVMVAILITAQLNSYGWSAPGVCLIGLVVALIKAGVPAGGRRR